ncbi:alanine racemase [Klebsormidium nitens]|uniref:Alanine racemase n=1 Tax=Klebsormidium nitens TaxID=105231 RepID=A0A1Y1HTB6_KLENI|nr:alanine racemase [Klebsormidium nitens]|eukprot:GAQ81860.1 alanine racemase [Klebsormidium nitens]
MTSVQSAMLCEQMQDGEQEALQAAQRGEEGAQTSIANAQKARAKVHPLEASQQDVPAPIRRCFATVNLDAIADNLRVVRKVAPRAAVCAVLKADAYGHGMVPVARTLVAGGAEWLGVALVEEAIELRRAGIETPILVWGQTYEGAYEMMVDFDLTPVLCTVDQFEALSAAVRPGATWKVHVEVDTGMARAGVPCRDLAAFVKSVARFKNVSIDGLMTHPANADSPSDGFNRMQLHRWREALEIATSCGLNLAWLHFANSPGALSLPKAGANLKARLVGTVCMDYCMVDVTHVAGVTRGDEVVLLGEQQGASIDAAEVAEWAGTISYEIVCNIGRRVPRRYVGGLR